MSAVKLVKIYKTRRRLDMYLYVDHSEDLARVPADLLERFGTPELAMTLKLTPDRKLARAAAEQVLTALDTQGFYLQMPPPDSELPVAGS